MTTPQERFVASINAIRREIDRLPNAAVAEILAELERTRVQVLAELLSTGPQTSFTTFRLTDLDRRLQDVMARFTERYGQVVTDPQEQMFTLGQNLAAQPLVEAGVTYAVPQISRRQLEVAQDFQALLVSGLASDAVAKVSQDLRLGLLRGESVIEVASKVAGSLQTGSTFGSISVRAEAITRTELGRIGAIATQNSLEEVRRLVPDVRKQWLHSGNTGPSRRLGHLEASGQIRDVDATFRVRPAPGKDYEELLYPRDPAASPENTIFCGCLSIPFRVEWAGAIEAA